MRLEACSEVGCSSGVTQALSTRPSRPTNRSVSSEPGETELTATWGADSGATSYLVKWRSPDGGFAADAETTTTGTSATFAVPGHGRWVVRVQGCNQGGCGRGVARTVTATPAAPTNLSVVPSEDDPLALKATWDAAAGATSYKLTWNRVGKSVHADNQVVTTNTSVGFTVSGYSSWAVQVKGCNEVGCGPEVSVTVVVWLPVCDRTEQVRDELVRSIGKGCEAITPSDLEGIEYLRLSEKGITTLKSGDFSGLPNITVLSLGENQLTTLPEGVFDGLSRLVQLTLDSNQLTELPEGVFDGLTKTYALFLHNNQLTALPQGAFDDLSSLERLSLRNYRLTELPEGVFDDIPYVLKLELEHNKLTALPEDVLDGLTNMEELLLHDNELTALPEGGFEGLTSLLNLYLNDNQIAALPDDAFDDLTSLKQLSLHNNELPALPQGVFDELPRYGNRDFEGQSRLSLSLENA